MEKTEVFSEDHYLKVDTPTDFSESFNYTFPPTTTLMGLSGVIILPTITGKTS